MQPAHTRLGIGSLTHLLPNTSCRALPTWCCAPDLFFLLMLQLIYGYIILFFLSSCIVFFPSASGFLVNAPVCLETKRHKPIEPNTHIIYCKSCEACKLPFQNNESEHDSVLALNKRGRIHYSILFFYVKVCQVLPCLFWGTLWICRYFNLIVLFNLIFKFLNF